MYWGCPGTLLGVTPYNVSILPRVVWVQCFCTAQGSVETLSLHCHSSGGQCGDIVPALPLIWGAVRRHCTRTAPGSTETIATGIAEISYGVPPNNVPGQPRDIVRGYLRQCRGSLFCLPQLNWESFIPFTFKCIPVSNRMTEQMRIIQTGTDQLYSLCSATYIHTTGSSKTLPSTGKCHIDLSVTVQCSVE